MEIQDWFPLINRQYRRWLESHPYAPLAEPVLAEIAEMGGPQRDDPHWVRESLWEHVEQVDQSPLSASARASSMLSVAV